MKIAGRRADGALYLSVGAGFAVILRGERVSPPQDESVIEAMGPWTWTPEANTFDTRKATERALDRARIATLDYFTLGGPPPWLAKKVEGKEEATEATDSPAEEATEKKKGLFVKKEAAVALDDTHKEKTPVSEIAQAKQEEVMNLPPNPPEDRKKKRSELRDKIRVGLKSQRKVEDVLSDEELSDDDLYAMAKALGITTEEVPRAVTLVDNATRFQQLLASTAEAKQISLAGGEHPFTYCKENVIPSMAKEGKEPDDPDAFCAWWKQEHGD